jgi:hypothetical protein
LRGFRVSWRRRWPCSRTERSYHRRSLRPSRR